MEGHGDGSNFLLLSISKKFTSLKFFSHLHESMGMRSDYLFRSLFLDYIFLLVPECVDGLFDS